MRPATFVEILVIGLAVISSEEASKSLVYLMWATFLCISYVLAI